MGVDGGNLQVIIDEVDVILENCPITIVVHNLLVYSTIQQYSNSNSNNSTIVYDNKVSSNNTVPQYNISCSLPPKSGFRV